MVGREDGCGELRISANIRTVKIHGPGLRAMRELAGFTATEFAQEIGVSPQFLCDLERGRRGARPPLVKTMAETLGVRTAALLREQEPAPSAS